jgi:hypothetical protein
LSGDQTALFQGTIGYVTVSAPTNGTAEILWSSPIYGYGRYTLTIGTPVPVRIQTIDTSGGMVTLTWSGIGNSFQLRRRSVLGSGSWTDIGGPVSVNTATDPSPPAGPVFYSVVTLN